MKFNSLWESPKGASAARVRLSGMRGVVVPVKKSLNRLYQIRYRFQHTCRLIRSSHTDPQIMGKSWI